MTGYTVHTGTSKKFVSGWDRVFGEKKGAKSTTRTTSKTAPEKTKKSNRKK